MASKKDVVRDLINARDYVWGHTEAGEEETAAMWAVDIVAEFLKVELPPWVRPTARPITDELANAEVDAAIARNEPPF